MNWEAVADVISAVFLVLGTLLALVAAIGTLRFPDVLTRMHAATKPQTLGMLMVLLALMFRLRDPREIGVLLAVALFQLLTAPVAAHMVGRAAYRKQYVAEETLIIDELKPVARTDDDNE